MTPLAIIWNRLPAAVLNQSRTALARVNIGAIRPEMFMPDW
jgi:hypothetical protein